jgi:succinate-acetate transporter protein
MAEESVDERLAKLENIIKEHETKGHEGKAPTIANPVPLGLFAFGITTLLYSIVNSGLVEEEGMSIVLGYGIFFGGLALLLAATWEFKRNHTFMATVFGSYSAFWMGLSLWNILAEGGVLYQMSEFEGAFAATMAVWGMFSFLIFIGSLKLGWGLRIFFLTLTVTFFLLAAGVYEDTVYKIAGVVGIISAFTAIYIAWAQLINELWEKPLLPWAD